VRNKFWGCSRSAGVGSKMMKCIGCKFCKIVCIVLWWWFGFFLFLEILLHQY